MRALYEARLRDLGPGDLIKVECICGHTELLTASMLATAGVKPFQNILALQYKLRWRECDRRGEGGHLNQVESPRAVSGRLPPDPVEKQRINAALGCELAR